MRANHAGIVEIQCGIGERAALRGIKLAKKNGVPRELHGACPGTAQRPKPQVRLSVRERAIEKTQDEVVTRRVAPERDAMELGKLTQHAPLSRPCVSRPAPRWAGSQKPPPGL